jgi:hypothetical protein
MLLRLGRFDMCGLVQADPEVICPKAKIQALAANLEPPRSEGLSRHFDQAIACNGRQSFNGGQCLLIQALGGHHPSARCRVQADMLRHGRLKRWLEAIHLLPAKSPHDVIILLESQFGFELSDVSDRIKVLASGRYRQ